MEVLLITMIRRTDFKLMIPSIILCSLNKWCFICTIIIILLQMNLLLPVSYELRTR